MNIYNHIFNLVERAVFIEQCRNAEEVAKYVRNNSTIRHVNVREIDKMIHKAATQYKA